MNKDKCLFAIIGIFSFCGFIGYTLIHHLVMWDLVLICGLSLGGFFSR